jgi:hypothetical protein
MLVTIIIKKEIRNIIACFFEIIITSFFSNPNKAFLIVLAQICKKTIRITKIEIIKISNITAKPP